MKHVTDMIYLFRKLGIGGLLLILGLGTVAAQQSTVKGKVTDETGEGAIGVTVLEKGTTNGAITDMDGNYSLTVGNAGHATLQYSFVGYSTKEEAVNGRTTINVALTPSVVSLGEVVAIGYGTQKRVNLTGAVGFIESKQMENRSVPTIAQALQGKVANLNISTSNGAPGSKYNFNVRGYTGINVDDKTNLTGSPLVVIDGVQGGDLASINMADVENISVLKDAASSAIYGSSAPFGVIIVTTKKGRAGKPVITYNNNFGFSQPTRLPHYVNSLDFANAFNEVGENSRYTAKLFGDDVIQRIKDYQSGKIKDETIKDPSKDEYYSWNAAHANNDWFDIYFKKSSFSQQHNIGVSSATENSNYYIGLGYNQQDGLYNWANDGTKRYNIRANISSNLSNWLTVGFRSAFARTQTDVPVIYGGISGGSNYSYDYFHQIGRTYPTVPLKNPDGNYSEGSGVGIFTDGGRRKETNDNAALTGEMVLHLLPGWDATANYTYSGEYIENSNHRKTFYLVRPSGEKAARGGTVPNYFERNFYKNQHHTVNAFTSYEKTIGKHYFKAMAGFTQELYDKLSMTGSNDNLYSDEIPMLSMTFGTNRNIKDAASQLAIRGGFGRINYNFEEKYLLELNGRYDGTSRFLKDVRNKFYPGASAAWVISKESFWEPISEHVNTLKLRGSYGSIGEQSFTDNYYPFYPSLGNNPPTSTNWIFSGGRESSFKQPGLVDPSLTWQTTTMLDLGFDLSALSSRLSLTFDWYRRHVKDFVVRGSAVPAFLGTNAAQVNNGEMETKGFDISLGWKDQAGAVSYGATLVLSDYTGKMLKYDNNPTKLISSMYYEGMTMGEIWGYETVGLFKDQAEIDAADQSYLNANWYPGDVHYKDLNGDGKINIGDNTLANSGDRKIIGNSTPRYSFGLTLNAEYQGFDATVFFQGVGKRDIMFDAGSNYFWGFVNNEWQSSYFTVHTDRWTPDNTSGYYPRAYFNTDKNKQAQTRYLQNAAYLRLKNLQLGYTIPKTITDRIKFQRARIFCNVENLATFTKLISIVDPEIVNGNAKVYPLQKTWAFGINLTF
ncbi:MAG: TonB-dependent receptor [Tannerellaceae bacterium]|jgi:TonB-linked SusC/RagA family outer membrane protein|nr:TonB-dependent receptor [Tannerellaceae bacterium]